MRDEWPGGMLPLGRDGMDSALIFTAMGSLGGAVSAVLAVWVFTRGARRERVAEGKRMSERLAAFDVKIHHSEQYQEGHDDTHDQALGVLLDIKRAIEGNAAGIAGVKEDVAGLASTVRGMEGRLDRRDLREIHAGVQRQP